MPGAVRTSIGVRGIPREEAHDVTSWVDGLGGDAPGRAGEALRGDAADPSNSDGTYKLGYLLGFCRTFRICLVTTCQPSDCILVAYGNLSSFVLHCGIWEVRVKYSELVEGNTTLTEKQEFLTGGEMTAITIRIPKNLKDAAAERAALKGISFSAYARMCMIAELAPEAGKGGAASVG